MKRIKVKRLIFTDIRGGAEAIGAQEYDGHLTDDNILGAYHEIGKTVWHSGHLWMLVNGMPLIRITVHPFYQYQKSWYNLLLDAIRRI